MLRRFPGSIVLICAVISVICVQSAAAAQSPQFGPPLGANDGVEYAPRVLRDGGRLVEDTSYDVQNPDLKGNTCFGVAWEKLWHAGQDLYRADGKSTAGAEVSAVADGTVAYANPDLNYPGLVVILEHEAEGGKMFSVYAHLDDNSLQVREGQAVERGDKLGAVLKMAYTGRFPELHPSGDDSHLHFELRRFLNAREIYKNAPDCNGLVAGRGYTHPQRPGEFPSETGGYVDPAEWVAEPGG
ncbi:MAG: M23 family metallopeptidase [Anaerolineae bacterium]|nr:M23 family metallopeptidase [Anaerolineae bacterium]